MDCGAAYMCIALSQILGFFFRKGFCPFRKAKQSAFKSVG